jgi:type I restriction enzyme S subunit
MTAQQLKNSILQMAVQGKLVPQDPNDEPASVLLERIRAEKERLIKEKKIKREKNPSVIFKGADNTPYEKIGDEVRSLAVPFDIPDGWVWVHPTDIGFFGSGKTPAPDQLSKFGTIPYFKVADMNATGNEVYLCNSNSFLKLPNSMKLFSKGAVVYPKNGGAVFTNKKRILGQDSLVDLNTGSYTPFSQMDEKFFYYLFSTVDFQKYYKGTALPTVDMDAVQEIVWGLPSLAEQKRIVTAIELTLPLIDKYEETHSQLSRLQNSFPEALKKSILQEAVQGKLVPQDPSDEPAEALLERIRAEKQRLIKEGKIKKDKHESVIFRRDNSHYEKLDGAERCIDDELPFEIPDSWEWVRLGTVFQHNTGKALNASNRDGEKLTYITTSNLYWDRFVLDNLKTMPFTDSEVDKCTVQQGDLLVCEGGDIGRAAIWGSNKPMRIQNHIHRLRAYVPVCTRFFYYLFYLYKGAGWIGGKGIAIQGLSSNAIHNLLFPLPPLHEQERIVSAIDTALDIVQKL